MNTGFTIIIPNLLNKSSTEVLNQTLNFEDEHYEVAVQDFMLPVNAIPSICAPGNWCKVCEYVESNPSVAIKYSTIYISERAYVSNDDLASEISKQIQSTLKTDKRIGIRARDGESNSYQLHLEKILVFLIFSPELNYILGVTLDVADISIVRLYDEFTFEKSIDLTRMIQTKLWLHGDFTKPQMIGKHYCNIISMITLSNIGVMEQHPQIQLYYVAVLRKRFYMLNLYLCSDIEGTRVNLQYPFIVTLHFRPRQMLPLMIHDGFPMIVTISMDKPYVALNTSLDFRERKYVVYLHDVWIDGHWPILQYDEYRTFLSGRLYLDG